MASISDSSASSSSSQSSGLSLETFNRQSPNGTGELEEPSSSSPLMRMIEEMQQTPELATFQCGILLDPLNVVEVLRCEPFAREKLVRCFLFMEKYVKNFVMELVKNFRQHVARSLDRPGYQRSLGFGSCLEVAKLLVNSGWCAEGISLVHVARLLVGHNQNKDLRVLQIRLLAESLSNRHDESVETIRDILWKVNHTRNIPMDVMVEIDNTMAVSYFEQGDFEASYLHGVMALQILRNDSSRETIVSVFRQLAKTCLARKRLLHAKLLITQAVSWALHGIGPMSVTYAKALEDYAYYLSVMNAPDDCVKVLAEARNIYYQLYGHVGLKPALAQDNLAFRLYLERKQCPIDQNEQFAVNLDNHEKRYQLDRTDDRQLLAVKRIHVLKKTAALAQKGPVKPEDKLRSIHPAVKVKEIRRQFLVLSNYGICYE